jgi:peptidoglycan/LPS O-acetylase OafA/YrhL
MSAEEAGAARADAPSIADLLRELGRQARILIGEELALARAEINEKIAAATGWSSLIALGAGLVFAGLLVLLAAAVLGLSLALPPWLAALIVGGATILFGVLCALIGRQRLASLDLLPERTLQTLREDLDWARSKVG